jgi:hypothetical protein
MFAFYFFSESEDSLTKKFILTQPCYQCHINDVAFFDILDSVVTLSSDGSIISSGSFIRNFNGKKLR